MMIKKHETARIRAFQGERQSSPEQIPTAFALLTPEIISILTSNLHKLCEERECLVIFGLQPASSMIESNYPINLQRVLPGWKPNYHLCCTLDYMLVQQSDLDQKLHWHETHSIIIDFTLGDIFDKDYYLAKVLCKPKAGTLYGRINPEALALIWQIVKIKSRQEKSTHHSALLVQ